jgi:hypothetical protein
MRSLPLAAQIEDDVAALLRSALARNSGQGVLVYQTVLKQLRSEPSATSLAAASEGLQKFLVGAEAHGHFTKEEWKIVVALRHKLADAS